MISTKQIAKHLREVYTGCNFTGVNIKDTLNDINWLQAIEKFQDLNTISVLVFHINYYVSVVLNVLEGNSLDGNDNLSFDIQPITCEEDWNNLVTKTMAQAEQLASKIESLEEIKLFDIFEDPKYGNYFRNLFGIIEHTHYHLGQISLIKKIIKGTGC